MGAECKAALLPFKLPDLKGKNTYNLLPNDKKANELKLKENGNLVFSNNHQLIK